MARIRTIKPEFWEDELIGTLPTEARLLFLGLISHADDEGRFRAHPCVIRSQIFAYDEIKPARVKAWLQQLAELGRIVLYENGSQAYGAVSNFRKHQRIDRPQRPRYPGPDDSGSSVRGTFDEHSTNDRRGVGEDSTGDPIRSDPKGSDPKGSDQYVQLEERRGRRSDVLSVIEHYRSFHPRALKSPQPTGREWRLIEARLQEGSTVEDLKRAIDGHHRSPFHLGVNDQGKKYLRLALTMRNASTVVDFAELADQPTPLAVSDKTARTRQASMRWLEKGGA